jgi:hypothetical protein
MFKKALFYVGLYTQIYETVCGLTRPMRHSQSCFKGSEAEHLMMAS